MEFAKERHPAYDHLDAKTAMNKRNGTQAGEPFKGAKAIYDLAVLKDPPQRAVIGTDAFKGIMTRLEAEKENYSKYEKISNSTDVDGYQAPS